MERSVFEELVRDAMQQMPKEILGYLENIDLIVEDRPTNEQLAGHIIEDSDYLLGLYEGVPLTERYDYGMVLPDRITLFQKSIEEICSGDDEVVDEVRNTVAHEVAHHFGIDDERLDELGA